MRRPGTITLVAGLVLAAAVACVAGALVNAFLWLQPGEVQLQFGREASDAYWVVDMVLCLVLAAVFAWLGRLALRGDPAAGTTITLIAVVSIAFSLFNLFQGYGWATLALSVLVLVLNQTASARAWYAGTVPARPGG